MLRSLIVRWIVMAIAFGITAWLLDGMDVSGGVTGALWVALIFGIVNAVIGTFLRIITLPLTILTLGLFILIINTIVILLVSWLVPGFHVDGFLTAFLFSILLWIVNSILHMIESRLIRPA